MRGPKKKNRKSSSRPTGIDLVYRTDVEIIIMTVLQRARLLFRLSARTMLCGGDGGGLFGRAVRRKTRCTARGIPVTGLGGTGEFGNLFAFSLSETRRRVQLWRADETIKCSDSSGIAEKWPNSDFYTKKPNKIISNILVECLKFILHFFSPDVKWRLNCVMYSPILFVTIIVNTTLLDSTHPTKDALVRLHSVHAPFFRQGLQITEKNKYRLKRKCLNVITVFKSIVHYIYTAYVHTRVIDITL